MTKFDKVQAALKAAFPAGVQSAKDAHVIGKQIADAHKVGIYIDEPTNYPAGPDGQSIRRQRNTYGFQVWFTREGQWTKPAGWSHISKAK